MITWRRWSCSMLVYDIPKFSDRRNDLDPHPSFSLWPSSPSNVAYTLEIEEPPSIPHLPISSVRPYVLLIQAGCTLWSWMNGTRCSAWWRLSMPFNSSPFGQTPNLYKHRRSGISACTLVKMIYILNSLTTIKLCRSNRLVGSTGTAQPFRSF